MISAATAFYALLLALSALVKKWLRTTILSLLLRRRAALFRRLATPSLPVRGLVFRSPLDEASLYLSTLALVTWSPFFVWSVINTCTRSIPLISILLIFVQCTANNFVPENDAFNSTKTLYMGAIWIACLYPAALLATLLMITAPALARGNRYAFGWPGTAVLDIQLTAIPEPADGIPVSLVSERGHRRKLTSLIHSSYYSDPSILQKIVLFLRGHNVGEMARVEDKSLRGSEASLRRVTAGAAVVVSLMAMLRYDYIEQQSAIWEEAVESVQGAGWREIFTAERIGLPLDPKKAHTVKFDFGAIAPGETCRLVGHYRSNSSRVDVLMHTVRLSQHSNRAEAFGMMDSWYEHGGAPLVHPSRPPPGSAATKSERVGWALRERAYEAGFQRTAISISGKYGVRKEVHFDRVLDSTEPTDVGGILVRNNATTGPMVVDLVVAVICRSHG